MRNKIKDTEYFQEYIKVLISSRGENLGYDSWGFKMKNPYK